MGKEIVKKGRRNVVVSNPRKKEQKEVRGFTINDRELWLTRQQVKKEFGCNTEKEAEQIWKDGKRQNAKNAKNAKTAPEAKKSTKKSTEERVYAIMQAMAKNGTVEFSSTQLRDKLAGEDVEFQTKNGRGKVRRAMRKLAEDGKVVIEEKPRGKRKQYVYRLKE